MNIKLSDNWIREFVHTASTPQEIAEFLSLTSVSVERMETIHNDVIYDIEVTQNRPDLMSALGIAREIAAILPGFGKKAVFKEYHTYGQITSKTPLELEIINDEKLVNRICAVALEVRVGNSPEEIQHRLETSGIRSLNNVIDVTNYVMREIGHPTHVFDLDRLNSKKMIIREAKRGEKVTTLDGKTHTLPGNDIVAENDKGEIIDLLGVMGTANSVVHSATKRILFFIDNNDPHHIRRTSMSLGIRSEAAVLNEKGIDPELAILALSRGIELFEKIADGRVISKVVDIYPNKPQKREIKITKSKIDSIIGVNIPEGIITATLPQLGFGVEKKNDEFHIDVPSIRLLDVAIEEDIVEEVARIYGYHNIPNQLPSLSSLTPYSFTNDRFYWESAVKNYLKNQSFVEVYTYSMVSEDQYEGPIQESFRLENELNSEHKVMRNTLIPSLLEVVKNNPTRREIKIFEMANIYSSVSQSSLPNEELRLSGVVRSDEYNFFKLKNILENICNLLGITEIIFTSISSGGEGADIILNSKKIGEIEIFDDKTFVFELNFDDFVKSANNRKNYTPLSQYPPIIEDLRFKIDPKITYKEFITCIKAAASLIQKVELIDVFEDKKTFRIYYQDNTKNLTDAQVAPLRIKIQNEVEKKFGAVIS